MYIYEYNNYEYLYTALIKYNTTEMQQQRFALNKLKLVL